MPITFETPIEGKPIPLVRGTYVKAEIKFSLKPSGTFEIGPGAEQKSLEEWTKKFEDVLKEDVRDAKVFLDPAAFLDDFRADTLNQDGLTLPEVKFNLAKPGVKIGWKIQGKLQNSGIKVAAEAILFALKSDDGKLDLKPPTIEFKAGKDVLALPPIKLSDWVTAKASIAVQGTLSISPDWGAIASWLIEEGVVDMALDAFFMLMAFYVPWKEAYDTCLEILEEQRERARVPKDAALFVRGYLEGLSVVPLDPSIRPSLDPMACSLYDAGSKEGLDCQVKTLDEMEDWWKPLNAAGKSPYRDWLAKNRSAIETQANAEALKQARRAAWATFNEKKSPTYPVQKNWWIYVYGQVPKDAGEVDVFLQYIPRVERSSLTAEGWI
jgi:hypothetical protein